MHILWTHIFKLRDVYLLIKGDQPPQRAMQGGLDGDDDGASQYTESAFQTSVKFLHSRSAAKDLDSLCL